MSSQKTMKKTGKNAGSKAGGAKAVALKEHIVEIISDSGEGAQRCGQSLGSIAARMGNGIWTTEIIPARFARRHAASLAPAATAFASARSTSPTAATKPTWSSPSTNRFCLAAFVPANSSRAASF